MSGLSGIRSIVVLMMENRSLDNFLGWIYAPGNTSSNGDAFNGLTPDLWNPPSPGSTQKYFVSQTTNHKNPIVDPGETYPHVNVQLFQSNPPASPLPATQCMGFLQDYIQVLSEGKTHLDPDVIMQAFDPSIVSCSQSIARQFAVCDQWFCSVPTQTWPNRSFVHAGTSNGNLINWPYDPELWNVPTIFNVMARRPGSTWRVYYDDFLIPLTWLQMRQLHAFGYWKNFLGIDQFYDDAANGNLPQYAFLEPSFFSNPVRGPATDAHPPHNAFIGDQFIGKVYNAVIGGPQFKNGEVLLVITFDEHGGTYDHVAPFTNATPPKQTNPEFDFTRFGVRVPTLVVSPYVTAGSVFNVPPGVTNTGWSQYTPYDHTSILATIENVFGYDSLTARDAAAPDLGGVLTLDTMRTDYEPVPIAIPPQAMHDEIDAETAAEALATTPLNDLQISMILGLAHVVPPAAFVTDALLRLLRPHEIETESLPANVGEALDFIQSKKRELRLP